MTRSWVRRVATGGVVLAVTVVGPLIAGAEAEPANPPPKRGVLTAAHHSEAVAALATEIGDSRTGGFYQDDSGRMVVTVTDDAAERQVRAAGAVPQRVTYTTEQLEAAMAALDSSVRVAGTAWGIDVSDNQVVVNVGGSVSEAEVAEIRAVVEPYGEAVRMDRLGGELELTISGGQSVYVPDIVGCSLGFNVRRKGDSGDSKGGGVPDKTSVRFFLTAGHCIHDVGDNWSHKSYGYIGYSTGRSFPGNDYGIVRYDTEKATPYGNVDEYSRFQDITHSRDPYDNEKGVCFSGNVSHKRCGGKVLIGNISAYYDEGLVKGLFMTNLCVKEGDSGGPVYQGNAALGLNSGHMMDGGNCYGLHQPVNEVLSKYGVEVY